MLKAPHVVKKLRAAFITRYITYDTPAKAAGTRYSQSKQLASEDCTPSSPDISQLRPILQSQWDHDKNAHLGNIIIKPFSHHKVWWGCQECPDGHPHAWEATVTNRTTGTGCPFCCSRLPCPHNSLATQAPSVAAQLSHLNQGTAHDYPVGSRHFVTWQCEHGHEWDAEINSRTGKDQTGCPTCYDAKRSQPRNRQPTLLDCQHPALQFWDWERNAKAGYDPGRITCGSHKRAYWICHGCPKGLVHSWQTCVFLVVKKGTRCPYCSNQEPCVCNSLRILRPDIAAEWDHSKNKRTPDDYTAGSQAKAWWLNDTRGTFQASINDRTRRRCNTQ